jgi:hypothetical protein
LRAAFSLRKKLLVCPVSVVRKNEHVVGSGWRGKRRRISLMKREAEPIDTEEELGHE